jgi:hypothetical protein
VVHLVLVVRELLVKAEMVVQVEWTEGNLVVAVVAVLTLLVVLL